MVKGNRGFPLVPLLANSLKTIKIIPELAEASLRAKRIILPFYDWLHASPNCAIKQAEYEEGGQINEVLAKSLNR